MVRSTLFWDFVQRRMVSSNQLPTYVEQQHIKAKTSTKQRRQHEISHRLLLMGILFIRRMAIVRDTKVTTRVWHEFVWTTVCICMYVRIEWMTMV